VRIIDVYVPNGQTVGSDKFEYKLRWLVALERYVIASLAEYPRLVVLGDYNIAPEDRDVHDPQAWQGSVHVSEPERAALGSLLATGLSDCFRLFEQPEKHFWWDRAAFRRNHGLRIDLTCERRDGSKMCGVSHRQGPEEAGTAFRPCSRGRSV
jgi:exodeoxyribonuclease-3